MELEGISIRIEKGVHLSYYFFTVGDKKFAKVFENRERPDRVTTIITQIILNSKRAQNLPLEKETNV